MSAGVCVASSVWGQLNLGTHTLERLDKHTGEEEESGAATQLSDWPKAQSPPHPERRRANQATGVGRGEDMEKVSE